MQQVVGDGLSTENSVASVKPSRGSKKEIHPLDADQVRMLLRVARGSRYEALFVLAVTTGLRHGELPGLRWDDIDTKRGKLMVRRTLQ